MIKWPKEWDPSEGWGVLSNTANNRPRTFSEPRMWPSLDRCLKDHTGGAHTRRSRIIALGGSVREPNTTVTRRTLSGVKEAVFAYYKKTGKRPSSSSVEWYRADQWVRKYHKISIPQICDEFGFPGRPPKRTLPGIKEEILTHYEKTGERPVATSNEWRSTNQWLDHHHKTSISKVCDDLNIPSSRSKSLDEPGPKIQRKTLPGIKEKILAHYKKTGQRPVTTSSDEWLRIDQWLHYHHHISLKKVCGDLLGMVMVPRSKSRPSVKKLARIEKKVRTYYEKIGNRPTGRTSHEWRNIGKWLHYHHKTTLHMFCLTLGMKSGRTAGRPSQSKT